MTNEELLNHLKENTPENKLRAVFSGELGKHEQAAMQRHIPTSVEMRKMEFESVDRILKTAQDLGLIVII